VSAPAEEIDWAAAEREERRRQWWAGPFLFAFFLGMALVRRGFVVWTGPAGGLVLASYLGLLLVMMMASVLVPRLRERQAGVYRAQAAVRRHADPGPELRERADRIARSMAGRGWIAVSWWLGPLVLVLGGRWDHPVPTVLGAGLMLGSAAVWSLGWLRQAAAARRWVAAPPGPPREPPPVTRVERYTSDRWLVRVVIGAAVLGVVVGVLVVLLG
jgi:hypothetical protein